MSLRKAAFGFAPNTISNCGLWLDAADMSTLYQDSAGTTPVTTNGQPIGLWRDKSGTGHDFTQATSVNRVTYDTSSKAAIQLSSPTFLQASAASLGTVSTSANLTIIMTASTGPSASWQIILAQWFTGTTRFHLSFQSVTDLTPALYSQSSGSLVKYNMSGTMAYNRTYTIGFIANGTSLYMSFMGTSNTTTMSAALSTNPTSALTIADSRNGNLTDGKIQEIIIYPYAISTTEFQQVESYLAQKWGITSSLPVGHPGLTTTVYRPDYIKNSVIVRNVTKPIPYFSQFSPRQISGLGLWLDAADSSTVSGTSPITAWTDKSGAGRTVTITSGPTYGTTSRGGNRTMSFNNNTITTSIASAVGTGDFTLVAVWYQSAAGTNTVLSLGTVASSSQSLGFSGNKYNFYQFGDVNESAYSTATPSWVIQIGTRIGSVKKVYINGNVGTTPSSTSYDVSVTTVTIGKGDNFAISGEIGEILIYTGTMSDTNRQLLESYLTQKWGLTASLPGGHSHFTKQVGAITTVANTKFTMTGVPRIIFTATGGTIVTSGFKYHVFTSSSNFIVSMDSKTVNYLVVGGGGGGGDRHGGGGGGGGVLTGTWTASAGTYTVTVGSGGKYGATNEGGQTEFGSPAGAGSKGGDAGEWSARKAQMVAKQYKAKGGGYK